MRRGTTVALAALALLAGCSQPQSEPPTVSGMLPHHRPRHHAQRRPAGPAKPSSTPAKTTGCHVRGSLPDPGCTPGAIRSVTLARLCTRGYTARVRNVPAALKASVYAAYGIASHTAGSYEVDHLIPLELGGSNARANLWPERAPGFGRKDALENAYHDAVCSGTLGFAVAQRQMARYWLHYAPKAPASAAPAQREPASKPRSGRAPSPAPSPSGHVICKDFSSHAEAQSYFDAHKGSAANLDRDGDGVACESLP